MSLPIKWTYDVFYTWYRKHFSYTSTETIAPIVAIVYESKRPKKKDTSILEPFVTRNLQCVGLSPLQNYTLFPNGLYVLYEKEPSHRKWMFFVFHTNEDCPSKTTVGNHFTFVIDQGDKIKPCHFHSTYYKCVKILEQYDWLDAHYKDYFPLAVDLPRHGLTEAIINSSQNQPIKSTVLDIMRYPWKEKTGSSGGKPKKGDNEPDALPIRSQQFAALWLERGYKQIHAIGIIKNNMTNWSVRIVRKGRSQISGQAYIFQLVSTASDVEFQNTLASIILQTEPF